MWKCKKCGEENEDTFDQCWKCRTTDDSVSPSPPAKSPTDIFRKMFEDVAEDTTEESVSSSTLSTSRVTVLSHWYSLISGFNTSTREFYAGIENQLKKQQVPGLELSRVDFAEGGLLSSNRQYLRIGRERLVFDICAAPFGKSYFFSCRFIEIRSKISILQVGFVFLLLMVMAFAAWWYAGIILGLIIFFTTCFLLVGILANISRMGLSSVDAFLLRDPLVGSIYEKLFRRETYYREDTRFMYLEIVNAVVKAAVEETTGAKGIRLLKFNEYSPILGELYKPTMVHLPPKT